MLLALDVAQGMRALFPETTTRALGLTNRMHWCEAELLLALPSAIHFSAKKKINISILAIQTAGDARIKDNGSA
jgi:hypothetical protein